MLLVPTSRPRPGSPSRIRVVVQDCADRAGMPAHTVASDCREAALPQAQGAALGSVKAQVIAKCLFFGFKAPWLLVSPAALPDRVRGRRTSQVNFRSQEDGRIRRWVREQTCDRVPSVSAMLLPIVPRYLRACRHGDCPAAAGQDDPGRGDRVASCRQNHFSGSRASARGRANGSLSLFFRGRCTHTLSLVWILRPKAESEAFENSITIGTLANAQIRANPCARRGFTCGIGQTNQMQFGSQADTLLTRG